MLTIGKLLLAHALLSGALLTMLAALLRSNKFRKA